MPFQTNTIIQAEPVADEESTRAPEAEVSLLDFVVLAVEHKRFIARFVLGGALLAIVVAFLLPVHYEAKITLLPPTQSSSGAAALLGQIGNLGGLGSLGSLGGLAGGLGLKTPTDMYVSMLTSRTVEDAMIHRFGLQSEYDEKKISDTRKVFERHTSVIAGTKDGLIRITLWDKDPKRASELANGYVDEFRKLTESLAITEAARRRLFFEGQLESAKENLTGAEEAMRKTQQTTGVLQIDSQARAMIASAAVLQGQIVAKEVQIQSMRSYASEDNPDLVLAKQQLSALQAQFTQVAASQQDTGSDILLTKGRMTEAGMQYIRSYRELKYRETVYELLAKELEIAKLDEAREGEIVQVVDAAVPPDKKSFPPRTVIVVGTTFFAFIVAIFWLRLRQSMEQSFELPENRHRLEAIRHYWNGKRDTV